ncbi:MAG: ABC transporter permease [Alphaproteobacteria bacterium]|nr:ABC transporter permease [Alphaproteobacteria bacterium]
MTQTQTETRVIKARRSYVQNVWRILKTAPPTAIFGMVVIAIYLFCALFAPWIAPYGEADIVGKSYQVSSSEHWLGTDQIGRDTLSRILFGARNTIGIALLTVLISFCIGGVLGIYAAVTRGWLDQILSRLVDVLMSIPVLIFALMLLTMMGKSVWNLVLILAVLDSTRVFRLARNTSLNIVVQDFVEAAKLRGEGMRWIVLREIVPNILPPLIAEFGLRFCFVFLTIAALSFLGVGIQPPTADWGSMVAESKTLITFGRPQPLIPAGAIALLTVAVNFVVDWFLYQTSGLRDEK